MHTIKRLMAIAKRKNQIDSNNEWSSGSSTYLEEIRKELDEVDEELKLGRQCYLEDELGDVFWDYLNILVSMEVEGKISMAKVFDRAFKKYDERISGIEAGILWSTTKERQKNDLSIEYNLKENSEMS